MAKLTSEREREREIITPSSFHLERIKIAITAKNIEN